MVGGAHPLQRGLEGPPVPPWGGRPRDFSIERTRAAGPRRALLHIGVDRERLGDRGAGLAIAIAKKEKARMLAATILILLELQLR